MHEGYLGVGGRTVAVLGAGATRGSFWEHTGLPGQPLPPLDRDFFAQLQRTRGSEAVDRLLRFWREEFGPEGDVGMEACFTHIEFMAELGRLTAPGSGLAERYRSAVDDFVAGLRYLLATARRPDLPFHMCLAKALEPGDTVISFNYDTHMDAALKEYAADRWDPEVGYGVSVVDGAELWAGESGEAPRSGSGVKLLKLHGSLNWELDSPDSQEIRLIAAPANTDDGRRSGGSIIPPALRKAIAGHPLYSEIWRLAWHALLEVEVLVFSGYSMPTADLLAQALFRAASRERAAPLRGLVVADPDPEARRRAIGVVRATTGPETAVIQMHATAELFEWLRDRAPRPR